MFLIKDSIIVTIFTIIISGAAGGLIATLYNAYYYKQVKRDIEWKIKNNIENTRNSDDASSKELETNNLEKMTDNRTHGPGKEVSGGKVEHSEEEKFYRELKKEIEVQKK